MTPEAERLLEALIGAGYGAPDDPDPIVVRWLEALGGETSRARALLEALRRTTIPAAATDEIGGLARWEHALGLPVAPAGRSEEQRRSAVLTRLRGRVTTSGAAWSAVVSSALTGIAWEVEENTPSAYQDTITIPLPAGSFGAGQLEEFIRSIHPAHRQVIFAYSDTFIVDVSEVGEVL